MGEDDDTITLSRFDLNGILDTDFGTAGVVDTGIYRIGQIGLGVQNDGLILVSGIETGGHAFALQRYHPNGAPDEFFGDGGTIINDLGTTAATMAGLVIQPNGRIVVAGQVYTDPAVGPTVYEGVIFRHENDVEGEGILVRDGRVTIHGGIGDDVLRIRGEGSTGLRAQLNGRLVELPDGLSKFTIRGFGGDDQIRMDKKIDVRSVLQGMEGDDLLYGGQRKDRLLGGSGADELIGRDGKDTLEGGSGADQFSAIDGFLDAIFGGKGLDTSLNDDIDILKSIESDES